MPGELYQICRVKLKAALSHFSVHRKREFPHVHHPLKSLKKKKKRKDQRKRKKKKKHEVKFTPSLPHHYQELKKTMSQIILW
jgi:hypothetical protein